MPLRRFVLVVLMMIGSAAVLATASPAAAAPTASVMAAADPLSPGFHNAVGTSLSCPGSGAVCYYDSQNFRNLLGYDIPPSSCSGTFSLDPWRNKIESIRNRTRCGVYLLYFCGTTTCWNEWMRPFSEDGTINPLNAIDQVRFS